METAGQESQESQDAGRQIRLPTGARLDTGEAAEPAESVRPPSVRDPGWRIGRCLGQGGTAAVWLAERTVDGARFALKMPHGAAADEFELRRELVIRSRLRHENLLEVHGLLATENGPGLLLEYAPGDSLARLVAVRKTLSEGETVTVLVAVARALACLHAEGSAHGDVSPGNVLFTANGKPLLADFGTSRMLGEGRDTQMGTPGFAAPLADASNPATGAALDADVYALGALGWFMLTGRALLPGLRPPLRVALPGLPQELRILLDAALDEDPAQRPAAERFAAEVFRAWPAAPVDLLAAVHPSVRPELRTRRSVLVPGKEPKRRKRLHIARRARKAPWEEKDQPRPRRSRFPEPADNGAAGSGSAISGSAAPAVPAELGRKHRSPRRPKRRSARLPERRPALRSGWLGAASVLVALTAGLGGVAVLAPEVLRPADEAPMPASRETSDGGGAVGERSPGDVDAPNPAGEPNPADAPNPAGEPNPDGAPNPAGEPGARDGAGASGDSGAGVGAAAESGTSGSPAEAEQAVLVGEDSVAAVRMLATLRARAYAEGDPGFLAWVNKPDSAAEAADLAGVELLHHRGERLAGFTVEVLQAERLGSLLIGPDPGEQVSVTAENSAYVQVGSDGIATAAPGAAGRQELVLEVVRTGQGWRIARVLPAAAGLEPGGGAQR